MSTIQNIKNFIRHGKQARLVPPPAEPTTDVSTIHAEPQRQAPGQYTPGLEAFGPEGRDNAIQKPGSQARKDRSIDIERLVNEENQTRTKMPRYPGLDRWILVEKMGDGAFSNVYRAKDSTTVYGEVAIKVVRKFEMNSNQVGFAPSRSFLSSLHLSPSLMAPLPAINTWKGAWPIRSVERSSLSKSQKSPQGSGGAQKKKLFNVFEVLHGSSDSHITANEFPRL